MRNFSRALTPHNLLPGGDLTAKGRLPYAPSVKRIATSAAVLAAVALNAAPASAGEPALPEETVSGKIIDVSCYGPCSPGIKPKQFEGEADVFVTDKRTGLQVARVSVIGPKYSVLVPPGRYRIVAVPYPQVPTVCWQGNSRRLHVLAGQAERRRLKVENVCVQ